MMLALILSPIGRWVATGLLIAALVGGFILKIQHDERRAVLVQIEQEKSDAINKAREARDRLRADCERSPADCVLPDRWFRDK
jgi:hypothetical protein